MTENTITISPSRFTGALDLARVAIREAAKQQRVDEFSLTGERDLLFHGQEVTHDVLITIDPKDLRAVLSHIVTAAEMWIEDLNEELEDAA